MTPVDLARLFLDPRGWRGRQYRFVPKMPSKGEQGIELTSLAGRRRHTIWARAGTTDMEVFHHVFLYRCYDTRRFARHEDIAAAYRSGKSLILDLGAYTGYSSIYFSDQWPEATVVAVEPDPDNYAMLVKNSIGSTTVEPLRAAAGRDGWVVIANPEGEAYGRRTELAAETTTGAVRSISVPSLLARYHESTPFICKIDIEGAERELFDDASWLDAFPLVIIELHDWLFPKKRTARGFIQAVASRDRDFLTDEENIFSVRN